MYKISDEQLIGYLYGEISAEEKSRIETHLHQSPETRKKMQNLVETRQILSLGSDEEVLIPENLLREEETASPPKSTGSGRWLGIAAGLALLLTLGYLLNLQISTVGNSLIFSFGPAQTSREYVSPERLDSIINSRLSKLTEEFQQEITTNNVALKSELLEKQRSLVSVMVAEKYQLNREEVQRYIAQLTRQELEGIKGYVTQAQQQQQIFIENSLDEFAGYMQESRAYEMDQLLTRMEALEQNTSSHYMQTGEILAGIISKVNSNSTQNN